MPDPIVLPPGAPRLARTGPCTTTAPAIALLLLLAGCAGSQSLTRAGPDTLEQAPRCKAR